MIKGRFGNTTGRPYIEAFLSIPSLQVEGMVSFIVDAGADTTVLMPLDAKRMKVDYRKLTVTDTSLGVGGKSIDFIIPAVFIIPDDKNIAHAYQFDLRIPQDNP